MVNVIHKSVSVYLLLSLFICLPCAYVIASPESKGLKKDTQHFIENKGQITDQFGKQRTDIDYTMKAGGLVIFVGPGHMHYQWTKPAVSAFDNEVKSFDAYRLDVILEGANTGVRPVAEQRVDYYENYYTANLQGVVAGAYDKLVYKNIYDNIDWVVYMHDGGLKYDFLVHAGGNPDDIRIRYDGASEMETQRGDIIAVTPYGHVTEKAPFTYYAHNKQPVPSEYVLSGNTIGFNIGEHNAPIVIDPSLEWATYMGGTGGDFGMCTSSDTAGNVYMGGRTASGGSSNVFTSGAHQVTFAAQEDGVITKYTAGGVRQWSTYYGGNGIDAINSITVDIENNIIFSGWTDTSYTGIASSGAHHPNHGGGLSDCFLVKMNPSGVRIWATYYGGEGKEKNANDYQTGVVCDTAKNIYMVGTTSSDTGIVTSGAFQGTRGGGLDGFMVKFNNNGVRLWATYYGGTNDDQFTNVGASKSGMIYTSGNFESSGMGTSGTHSSSKPGGSSIDVLIGKFNPLTGNLVWATYYGGSDVDHSRGSVVGDTNYVYICGSTTSTSGIASTGATQSSIGGGYDMFLAKFDSTGNRVWGTYLGGSGLDQGGNVVLDHSGNLNTTGITNSTSTIASPDAFQSAIAGGVDAFMAIYNSGGSKLFGTYYGGTGNDYGYGVARGKSEGHIYFAGNTESSSGISLNGSQNTLGGANDAFLVKITPDTSVSIVKNSINTVYCAGDSFTLDYVTTEPFRSGNVFTVQLSNASGNFTSPVNIGTKTSSVNGSIRVGFPSNSNGTGYRIRIVATLPIDTSYDNEFNINVKPLPIQPVASNNGPMCSNGILQLNSTNSTTGAAFTWTGPDSYTASTQNATRSNMTASLHTGKYFVTADLNGCTRKDSTTVTIIQAAAKPDASNNGPLCEGDNLILTSTNITSGATISWIGPNSFSSGAQNPPTITNVSGINAGNYIITLTYNGCLSKDTTIVTIGPKPNPVTGNSNSPVCTHETLLLTANTSTPGVVYNWSGPGGFVANNQQNPQRTNLQTTHSGDYIVEADMLGCKVKDTVKVTILQSPGKPVATSNSPLCSGEDLQLTGSNITGGAIASWLGPKGAISGASPKIVNAQVNDAGTYILTSALTGGCSQSDTITVSITQSYTLPITAVINPGTVVCPTAPIVMYATPPQTGATYKWTNPAMQSFNQDTLKINSAVYADSGYYIIQVVTAACSLGVDTVHLSVVDTITPPTLTLPGYVCEQDTLVVNIYHPYLTSGFTLTYPKETTGPFSGITLLNMNKTDHEGRYILRANAGGCTAADTGYLTVRPKPAKPNATNNTPVCEGEDVQLTTGSVTPGVTYDWYGPSGYASTTQNPLLTNVIPTIHGGYYISRSFLNGCYSNGDSTEVIIHENPKPEIAANNPVCEGSEINLSVTNNNSLETYTWTSSNAGFSGSGSTATVNNAKLTDAGEYKVSAVSTVTGCTGSDTINVDVIALPGIPDAFYNGPLCEGKNLELNVNDTSTLVNYAWSGPNGYAFFEKSAFKNVVGLADSGLYTVVVSRLNCYRTDSVYVRIKPTPPAPVITSNTPLASGETLYLELLNPLNGASFRWTGPGNFASLVQNPVLFNATVDASGTYTATTTFDGCSSSAITIVIVNKGDVKREELILFPNPNNGTFTVKAKVNSNQIMPYEVVNAVGMVVYSDIVQTVNQQMERKIEIDGRLASGVYIFRIMMSGQSKEIPFSIVR